MPAGSATSTLPALMNLPTSRERVPSASDTRKPPRRRPSVNTVTMMLLLCVVVGQRRAAAIARSQPAAACPCEPPRALANAPSQLAATAC